MNSNHLQNMKLKQMTEKLPIKGCIEIYQSNVSKKKKKTKNKNPTLSDKKWWVTLAILEFKANIIKWGKIGQVILITIWTQ